MTKLMQQFVDEASRLPEEKQDEWAADLLAQLHDDLKWNESFARTTPEQWSKMADHVRRQIKNGEGVPLDPDAL